MKKNMMKKILFVSLVPFFTLTFVVLTARANAEQEPRWKIDPNRAALLVIDMQNDVIEPDSCCEVAEARPTVPTVKKLIEGCRRLGVPVVYTAHVHHRSGTDLGLVKYLAPKIAAHKCLLEGTRGAEVYPEIAPKGDERIIYKHTWDAFYSTNLEKVLYWLRGEHVVNTLIFSGTITNCCIESTARSAFSREFRIVLAKDATSTLEKINPGAQKATEDSLSIYCYARIMTVDEILKEIKEGM